MKCRVAFREVVIRLLITGRRIYDYRLHQILESDTDLENYEGHSNYSGKVTSRTVFTNNGTNNESQINTNPKITSNTTVPSL